MFSYPIWLLLFLILPLAVVWGLGFQTLRHHKFLLALTAIGCLAVSVPWDILSVRDHIWSFAEPHVVGLWLLGLPLEEYVYIVFLGLLSASLTILLWERYGAGR